MLSKKNKVLCMDVKRFRSPCELAVFLAIVLSALTITALFPFGASGETEDADFEVVNCVAKISPHQTLTIEVAGYLRYISPYLVASATVECSIPSGEDYTIGFIQQVDDLQLRMEYERATTSWEMPFFPINDASGALLPWYHAREGSADQGKPELLGSACREAGRARKALGFTTSSVFGDAGPPCRAKVSCSCALAWPTSSTSY